MSKTKKLKTKLNDGSFSEAIFFGVDGENVDLQEGVNLEEKIKTIEEDIILASGSGVPAGTIVAYDGEDIPEGYNEITLYDLLPVGCGMDYWGDSAPVNYMFADGSELFISDYPALYAVIGTKYGGDGENTFNLPDKRARVSVMADSSNVNSMEFNYLGQIVGSDSTTLTEVPAHSHSASVSVSVSDSGHSHTYNDYYATSSSAGTWDVNKSLQSVTSVGNTYTARTSNAGYANLKASGSATIGTTGNADGVTFSTIQSSIVCNYIIKVM